MQGSQPKHPCRASKASDKLRLASCRGLGECMRRWGSLFLCVGFGLLAAGCPKGQPDYNQGKKAETIQDYDAAFVYYQKAANPTPNTPTHNINLHLPRFQPTEFPLNH